MVNVLESGESAYYPRTVRLYASAANGGVQGPAMAVLRRPLVQELLLIESSAWILRRYVVRWCRERDSSPHGIATGAELTGATSSRKIESAS